MRQWMTVAMVGLVSAGCVFADGMGLLGVDAQQPGGPAVAASPAPGAAAVDESQLWMNGITLVDGGRLKAYGEHASPAELLDETVMGNFRKLRASGTVKGLVVHMHGGLVDEANGWSEAKKRAKRYLPLGYYPISIVWNTDKKSMLRQVGGDVDDEGGFWLGAKFVGTAVSTWLNKNVNPFSSPESDHRTGGSEYGSEDYNVEKAILWANGHQVWLKMKQNAIDAVDSPQGGARVLADAIVEAKKQDPGIQIHVVAHSAGGLMACALVQYLTSRGVTIDTVQLAAPAITTLFAEITVLKQAEAGGVRHLTFYNLTTKAELDDSVGDQYGKSLLCLVRNALDGEARDLDLAGLDSAWEEGPVWMFRKRRSLMAEGKMRYVLCPTDMSANDTDRIEEKRHGDLANEKSINDAIERRITSTRSDNS